jgi:hypothetical protein
MSQLDKIRSASAVAETIIASFTGVVPEDAAATRTAALLEEVAAIPKAEKLEYLIAKIVELEKPKSKDGITVESVARKFMEAPELSLFTWPQIALLVKRVLPEANTSSKSIASYASKRKEEWNIAPREKFAFDPSDFLAQASNQ